MQNGFFKRYGFRILIVIVFLLPFVWMGTKRTLMSNSNNVADWLPSYFTETQQYNWFLEHFPYERFVVVSWKGCTMDDTRLEMFAQKLVPSQSIDDFASLSEGPSYQAEFLLDPKIEAPATESLQEEKASEKTPEDEPYYAHYFKSVVTGPRLLAALREQYSGDGIGGVSMTDREIFEKLKGTLISPDGHGTAMMVTLATEAPHGKDLAKVLEAIREIGRECGVHPPVKEDHRSLVAKIFGGIGTTCSEIVFGRNPDMSGVILGGPPTDNVAITHEGEHTLRRLAGICGLIGLFLAWLCFRNIRLTMFVFWVSIISAGAALACVALTGSRCDAILLSMPALVYVLSMSGAVHMINYYHDAIQENGVDGAPERALMHAWKPCFFASFTTALGMLSLYTSHLIPITKFGVYSALGVMLGLLILFYYLPSLLYFFPSKHISVQSFGTASDDSFMQRFWRAWGGFIVRNNRLVALACVGLMIFFAFGMLQIKTSVKMMRFFSADSEIIHHYTWLEEHLGPLVPMEIVLKFDNERCKFNTVDRLRLVEDINAALREKLQDGIGGILSAESALPVTKRFPEGGRKSARQIGYERAASSLIDNHRAQMRDFVTVDGNRSLKSDDPLYMETLRQLNLDDTDASRLVRAGLTDTKKLVAFPDHAVAAGISSDEMDVFRKKAQKWEKEHGTDLWRISLRVWSLKRDIDYALFVNDVQNVANPIIDRFLKEKFPNENFPEHTILVKEEEKGTMGKITGWFSGKADSIADLFRPSETETAVVDYPVEAVYTGMVPVVYKTQHELINGLVDSFVSSFILIGVTMAFILRSPVAGFCAMIPNVFPVVIVFGFMGRAGFLVDVGTMMTASVALGIAVDDTIHFLTWFRDGIDNGMNQKEATMFAYSRCATSMFQTTLIAGLGLSAFALSTFTPTQMFGIMMLAILTAALFGDIIFLAALLNTPLGRVFRPRLQEKEALDSAVVETEATNLEDDKIPFPKASNSQQAV